MSTRFDNIIHNLDKLNTGAYYGTVTGVQGLFIEVSGISSSLTIGDRCSVHTTYGKKVPCDK